MIIPKTRWLALVPFGAGQFQNGEKNLGYVFLSSELLLAGSTVLTLGIETHLILATSQAISTSLEGHGLSDDLLMVINNWGACP